MTAEALALPHPGEALRVALVGSPNSGKTTLFNALTGSSAHVGNYPGVTVERRCGVVRKLARRVEVLDLPGLYSLEPETPDEAVVGRVLAGEQAGEAVPHALLVVVDATSLSRSLGLVVQVLQSARPTLLVLSMVDELRARGGSVDLAKLSSILGIPVLGVVGHRGVGLDELRDRLLSPEQWSRPQILPPVEDHAARFDWVDRVVERVSGAKLESDRRTDRIDRILLHPVGGSP